MRLSISITSLTFLSLVTGMSAQARNDSCMVVRYPPPSVRYPPDGGYRGHNFAAWTPPPPEQLYGTYHFTHTSFEQWILSLVNLRAERYPIFPSSDDFPAGSESEVGSWSTCVNPKSKNCKDPLAVTTVFGQNTRIGALGPTDKKAAATWVYNATGTLENMAGNVLAILAYGEDRDGYDYYVQYETDVNVAISNRGGGISIASRNERGINSATRICLLSSLKQLAEELEDNDMSAMVSRIKPLGKDNRRSGQGPVECDASCVDNAKDRFQDPRPLHRRSTGQQQAPLNSLGTYRHAYPMSARRGMPWWAIMTMCLVFGIPLVSALCIAVPIALWKGHRLRQLARAQRMATGHVRNGLSSSVVEPQMVHTG